jgi:hypothetical protein
MFSASNGIADGVREERAAMHDRAMDWRQRRLHHKVDSLQQELEREHEARRVLADAIASTGRTKRSHGILRLLVVGGGAYVLGTRAGRERFDQMAGWVRGVRDRVMTTARGVREETAQAASQVRDVAADTARTVGEDMKATAAQIRANTIQGARQVSDETGDAAKRLKKDLAPANDTVEV